ncbi:MAG: RagB/SusD family nutrient uptake outer membrane protein [Gemmatimonas sp.]|nr:RagB/SusD family nutrient uptake outer membrane protein [Gemmatimonas sp.]
MLSKSIQRLVLTGGVLLLGAGCDLDVINVLQPDRERALADPEDLEALIGGAFSVFFSGIHGWPEGDCCGHVPNMYPNYATEMTGIPLSGGSETVVEPRLALTNTPSVSIDGPRGHRILWQVMNLVASNVHDGLRTLDETDVRIVDEGVDVTPRARAFAKLMQGIAWGYMAMGFDKALVIPETEPLGEEILQQGRDALIPAEEARQMALASIEAAKEIASQNGITFPAYSSSPLFFGTPEPMTTDDFVRVANTFAARILALSARTPAERRQVAWGRVLELTTNGLTRDLEYVLDGSEVDEGQRSSLLYFRLEDNVPGCANCFRWDNRLIGQADISGRYQTWLATPLNRRDRFDIATPDRRITGATPQSNGAYTRYWGHNNGFPEGRGLYFRSGYQWARHFFRGFDANSGTAILASADENRLLRAEALIHMGDLSGAAELINVTRTRSHTLDDGITYPGLPPVTRDGVPESADCAPRIDSGACGDLMVALRYERMIELAGLDAFRGFADSRGFGLLPDDSFLVAPVPGNELEVFSLPIYTFGGDGGEWSARYAPVTMADMQ